MGRAALFPPWRQSRAHAPRSRAPNSANPTPAPPLKAHQRLDRAVDRCYRPEACRGEFIVLTDGDRQVALEPRVALDLEEDSPELEAELVRAVNGPHAPLAEGELRETADKALAEHRARRQK